MNKILNNIDYFTEWGGYTWRNFVKMCIDFLGHDLQGKTILDLGTHNGRMACFFALLGANVIGLDIDSGCLIKAVNEKKKWKLNEKVSFVAYDGNLDIFKDESFDVIFTKSVLVVVNNLDGFLKKIKSKLKPGGKVIFIENGRGNYLLHFLRRFRHPWYNKVAYFTDSQLSLIKEFFKIEVTRKSYIPPIYLICGENSQ